MTEPPKKQVTQVAAHSAAAFRADNLGKIKLNKALELARNMHRGAEMLNEFLAKQQALEDAYRRRDLKKIGVAKREFRNVLQRVGVGDPDRGMIMNHIAQTVWGVIARG